ncbi:hypothetical protein Syun_023319 [Stephania yunnanensis]|uniref:Uncharacterized protein n=1 Tax=Stephania yunnanensis TaxID=152371 RepID=A0AAP0HZH3_9MAGN
MVISAPTGSGKTVLFELCILRLLSRFLSQDGKFNHACAFRDSYEKFKKVGAEVIGISGDDSAFHKSVALSVGDWFFDRVGVSAIDCPYPYTITTNGAKYSPDQAEEIVKDKAEWERAVVVFQTHSDHTWQTIVGRLSQQVHQQLDIKPKGMDRAMIICGDIQLRNQLIR